MIYYLFFYILLLLSFILHYLGFKTPEKKKPITKKVILIENFDDKELKTPLLNNIINENKYESLKKKSFCNQNDLEKKCNKFNKNSCILECCVCTSNKNGGKCVEGNAGGPIMKKDDKLINYDEYYYLNKKYKL